MPTATTFVDNVTSVYDRGTPTTVAVPAPILSTEQRLIGQGVITSFYIIVSFLGTSANALNIVIFVNIGVKDSISVNFLCLSIADLFVTFCSLCNGIVLLLRLLQSVGIFNVNVDMMFPYALATNAASSMTMGSVLLTTYMAVQRCCCVALPFRFSGMFTKQRSIYVAVSIAVLCLGMAGLYTSFYKLEWKRIPNTNVSMFFIARRPHRKYMFSIVALIYRMFINIGCHITVTICVVILGVRLWTLAKFRNSSVKQVTVVTRSTDLRNDKEASVSMETAQAPRSEIKIIKTTCMISTVFVFCNIPAVALSLARTVPGFDAFGVYGNLYEVITTVITFCESLCSSVNIFVFLTTNSKFKATMKEILSLTNDDVIAQ